MGYQESLIRVKNLAEVAGIYRATQVYYKRDFCFGSAYRVQRGKLCVSQARS